MRPALGPSPGRPPFRHIRPTTPLSERVARFLSAITMAAVREAPTSLQSRIFTCTQGSARLARIRCTLELPRSILPWASTPLQYQLSSHRPLRLLWLLCGMSSLQRPTSSGACARAFKAQALPRLQLQSPPCAAASVYPSTSRSFRDLGLAVDTTPRRHGRSSQLPSHSIVSTSSSSYLRDSLGDSLSQQVKDATSDLNLRPYDSTRSWISATTGSDRRGYEQTGTLERALERTASRVRELETDSSASLRESGHSFSNLHQQRRSSTHTARDGHLFCSRHEVHVCCGGAVRHRGVMDDVDSVMSRASTSGHHHHQHQHQHQHHSTSASGRMVGTASTVSLPAPALVLQVLQRTWRPSAASVSAAQTLPAGTMPTRA